MNSETPYTIVAPKDYTAEHRRYIAQAKKAIQTTSELIPNAMMGIIDTELKGIIATNFGAKICGIKNGNDLAGMDYRDYPLDEIAEQADNINTRYAKFLTRQNPNEQMAILNIYNYTHGKSALLAEEQLFCHHPSRSILGIHSAFHELELNAITNLLLSHTRRFGNSGSRTVGKITIEDIKLDDDEQLICFLFLNQWPSAKICEFMNYQRRGAQLSEHKIYNLKNHVCSKLGIFPAKLDGLIDRLVACGFHNHIPRALLKYLKGSTLLNN